MFSFHVFQGSTHKWNQELLKYFKSESSIQSKQGVRIEYNFNPKLFWQMFRSGGVLYNTAQLFLFLLSKSLNYCSGYQKHCVTKWYRTRDILRSSQKQPEAIIKWELFGGLTIVKCWALSSINYHLINSSAP